MLNAKDAKEYAENAEEVFYVCGRILVCSFMYRTSCKPALALSFAPACPGS